MMISGSKKRNALKIEQHAHKCLKFFYVFFNSFEFSLIIFRRYGHKHIIIQPIALFFIS